MFHYSPYASAYAAPRHNPWDGYLESFDNASYTPNFGHGRPVHRAPPRHAYYPEHNYDQAYAHEARIAQLRAELAAAEEEEQVARALYRRRREIEEQNALRDAIESRRLQTRAFEEALLKQDRPTPFNHANSHPRGTSFGPGRQHPFFQHLQSGPIRGHRGHFNRPERQASAKPDIADIFSQFIAPKQEDTTPVDFSDILGSLIKVLQENSAEPSPTTTSTNASKPSCVNTSRPSCCTKAPESSKPKDTQSSPKIPEFHGLLNQFLGGAANGSSHPLQQLMTQFLGPEAASNLASAFAPEQPVAGPSGTSSSSSTASAPAEKPLTASEREQKEIEEAIRLSLETASAAAASPASEEGKGKAKDLPKNASEATPQDIQTSLATIDTAEVRFRALTKDFDFPLHLDFKATPSSSRPSSPVSVSSSHPIVEKLSFTPNNAPVHHIHEGLVTTMKELDEVPVYDNEEVANRRREVLVGIEDKLEEIEQEIEGRWKSWDAKHKRNVTVEEVEDEESKSDWSDVAGNAA
ncbi:hypothetical protein DL96DRAFT_1733524 [Flagelloscypha sp. PMI_526]|nr:hypothetical protein DL96DRAFT_1733524 [Flagelloscypha sp. PMI_526]